MTWRVARSLDTLLAQLNALAPKRSRASDGSIGDAAHQAQGSASDHNAWFVLAGQELVTARDITHDPANGLDCNKLAAALIASRDPRIKYIIWRGELTDSRAVAGNNYRPWTKQPSSGHYQHLHLSVMANASADDPRPWSLPGLIEEEEIVDAAQEDRIAAKSANAVMGRIIPLKQFAGGVVAVSMQGAMEYLDYRTQSTNAAVAAVATQLGALAALMRQVADNDDRITLDPAQMEALTADVNAKLQQIKADHQAALTEQAQQFEEAIDELAAQLDGRDAESIRAGLRTFFLPAVEGN